MDYEKILEEIYEEITPLYGQGKVADYIPALARVKPKQFAMSLKMFDGTSYDIGDADTKFSIQSVSKVFTFTKALKVFGKSLYKKVGHEPSGNPFNSLVQLEYEEGIPRNPFINAGAIVVTDTLLSRYKSSACEKIFDFVRTIGDDGNIEFDEEVFVSEAESGYRNYALVNMMKSFGNIQNDIDEVMNLYFKHCAIRMNTKQLCRSMLFLANHGIDPITKKKHLTMSQAKRINSLMLTCAHYDAWGAFAFRVGLPGKSGVGGGIVAVIPGLMSLSVWSPELNDHGNSLVGTKALELFTTKTGLSIF